MATTQNACTCITCAGSSCTCGCRNARSVLRSVCKCGAACACGPTCRCQAA